MDIEDLLKDIIKKMDEQHKYEKEISKMNLQMLSNIYRELRRLNEKFKIKGYKENDYKEDEVIMEKAKDDTNGI